MGLRVVHTKCCCPFLSIALKTSNNPLRSPHPTNQRPDRTIDIEAGLGHYRELEEEAKKGEAGFHPIVAHLWTIVR